MKIKKVKMNKINILDIFKHVPIISIATIMSSFICLLGELVHHGITTDSSLIFMFGLNCVISFFVGVGTILSYKAIEDSEIDSIKTLFTYYMLLIGFLCVGFAFCFLFSIGIFLLYGTFTSAHELGIVIRILCFLLSSIVFLGTGYIYKEGYSEVKKWFQKENITSKNLHKIWQT